MSKRICSVHQLARQVGTALHGMESSHRAAVMIDPILRDPLNDEFLAELDVTRIPISVPNSGRARKTLPYMLVINECSHGVALLQRTCAEALNEQQSADEEMRRGFAIGPWITYDCPEKDLARHWARASTIRLDGIGMRHLRLTDRRVLQWLWLSLDNSERRFAMGPVTSIHVLGRDNTLVKLPPATDENQGTRTEFWARPMSELERCESVQAMLRGWASFEPALPADHLELAQFAVNEAAGAGAVGVHDQVLLGAYSLQVHPHLCRSPALRAIVASCNETGESLALRLTSITDAEWGELGRCGDLDKPYGDVRSNVPGESTHGRW